MLDAAARALGCVVIPAGTGQTELQVKVAVQVGATGYLGTPSFLHALLAKAREAGTPLHFEAAFVLAEMLPESLRAELEQSFGVRVLQGYGTADLGCLAYECPEKGGLAPPPGGHYRSAGPRDGYAGRSRPAWRGGRHHLRPGLPSHPVRHRRPLRPGAGRSLPVRTHQRPS